MLAEGLSKGLSTGFRWLGRGIGVYNARDLFSSTVMVRWVYLNLPLNKQSMAMQHLDQEDLI